MSVPEGYFVLEKVDEQGMTVKQFCDQHNLHPNKHNICLEVNEVCEEHKDVLLMDKVEYRLINHACTDLKHLMHTEY